MVNNLKKGCVFMNPAGFILKIDQLGRIVIPKPLRKKLELELGDSIEVFNENDGIFLNKYCTSCSLCGSNDNIVTFQEKAICENCLNEIKNQF